MTRIFITATDTDAGKTYIATLLVQYYVERNKSVAVYKPVSAGCELINNTLVNEDARQLLQAANCHQTIQEVNPIAFKAPIAPHIAAKEQNKAIELAALQSGYDAVLSNNANITITEGAGGWRLPLGNGIYMSEFAIKTKQSVILVVNMKLGCLNHAVLTYQSIINDGLTCIGWIANIQEDMPYLEENLAELKLLISAPHIATVTKNQTSLALNSDHFR